MVCFAKHKALQDIAASNMSAKLDSMSLEQNAIFTSLTLWAFTFEYSGSIGSINVMAAMFETSHAISVLTMVCSRYSTMASTLLIVSINETNFSSFSVSVYEIFHTISFLHLTTSLTSGGH
jgi:hypothetical protein